MTGWQYTGNTMDRSEFYLDADGWHKLAKGDGNAQPITQPQPQPTKKAATESTAVSTTWQDSLGVTWHAENGKFTVGSGYVLHLRWGATPSSSVIAVLYEGSVVNYDAWARTNDFVYLRQPRGNGQYGYIACRDARTNEAYGSFE